MTVRRSPPPHVAPAIIVLGCIALAGRPPASPAGLIVIVGVGVAGLLAPLKRRPTDPAPALLKSAPALWLMVVGLGLAAVAIARALITPVHAPVALLAIAATTIAAIAEEAFFRRLVYGWLDGWSPWLAAAGAAMAFALVHLPGYGAHAVPVNLAAGLLLGWQRWATGDWTAPAVTHVTANVLQLL